MITLTDKPVTLHSPEDPDLARLWDLAVSKFISRRGRAPETRADARAIVDDYQSMLLKPQGSVATVVAQLVQERCAEVRGGD